MGNINAAFVNVNFMCTPQPNNMHTPVIVRRDMIEHFEHGLLLSVWNL